MLPISFLFLHNLKRYINNKTLSKIICYFNVIIKPGKPYLFIHFIYLFFNTTGVTRTTLTINCGSDIASDSQSQGFEFDDSRLQGFEFDVQINKLYHHHDDCLINVFLALAKSVADSNPWLAKSDAVLCYKRR